MWKVRSWDVGFGVRGSGFRASGGGMRLLVPSPDPSFSDSGVRGEDSRSECVRVLEFLGWRASLDQVNVNPTPLSSEEGTISSLSRAFI